MRPTTPVQPGPSERHRVWRLAIATGLGSWLVLAGTAPQMPIVWDEGEYMSRADRIVTWLGLLFDGGSPLGGLNAFSTPVIQEHWPFISYSEGHPAWFAIPIALSQALLGGLLHPLTAARLGPITVFSVACGGVALRLEKQYGAVAALVAPIALLTLPRMFSDAHFAAQDAQLTAWWLLLWVVDSADRRGPRTAFAAGVLVGLSCATKFTGWAAWIPVTLSRAVGRDPARLRELPVLLPTALLTFYVVNPPLWHAPIAGLITHFWLSLGRADTWNIPTVFLGVRHDLLHPLPWYNAVAWLALATPVPTLVLGLLGVRNCLGQARSWPLLLHWATPMVIRSLPSAPPHDGIRLFLPAFGFWCVLAGIGAQRVWEATSRLPGSVWRGRSIRGLLVASLAAAAINVARYYPQTLSHYSLLVGGVRGAASIGMEPTYWWDALDDDVLDWINRNTEPTAAVAFSYSASGSLTRLRDWGRLRAPFTDPKGDFAWYVLQNRTGMLSDVDRVLIRSAKPAYTKYAGRHAQAVPADLEVPLILIFSAEQYAQAASSTLVRD